MTRRDGRWWPGVVQGVEMRLFTRARRDAAMLGVAAGTAATIAATLLAVLGQTPRTPAGPNPPSVSQARLRTALLAAEDLPPSFAPHPIAVPAKPLRRTERCAELVADPVTVLRRLSPSARPPAMTSARHLDTDRGVLDQAVRVFDRGKAATAIAALRQTAQSCPAFTARLDDGTTAHVKITATGRGNLLIGDSYKVSMILRTPRGQQERYLAVGRVGDVVSALRRTAPSGADQATLDKQIDDLVLRAVSKIVDLGGLAASPQAQ